MKVVGVIAEYNPFHNGHWYHIEEAKRQSGADYVVVVMSGNFLQRGAPALLNKYQRTQMALMHGVDLVLELPAIYATGSAEFFATGAVLMLEALGIVDYLCFGSEAGDLEHLNEIAALLLTEPPQYKELLNQSLRGGDSFPVARSNALKAILKNSPTQAILTNPNNILGIEYLKALIKYNCRIKPLTIKRIKSEYHDTTINEQISSATAIRTSIINENSPTFVLNDVPNKVGNLLKDCYNLNYPVQFNDFSLPLQAKLINQTNLSQYLDMNEELEFRLLKKNNYTLSIDQLAEEMKSKQITRTRINRCLTHILLDLKQNQLEQFINDGWIYYERILGFQKSSSKLLARLRKTSAVPIINKLSNGKKLLPPNGLTMLEQDIQATHLYNLIVLDKFGTTLKNEYKTGIIQI